MATNYVDFQDRPLVIRTNYGDESIALVQWAYEQGLKDVLVVYVETGWQAVSWEARVLLGEQHVKRCEYQSIRISSNPSFSDAVLGRGSFPSYKFQWCAGWLKGLPFLDWLDKIDKACRYIILIAKRREASKAQRDTPEWIEACEYHNDRTVWHPLVEVNEVTRDALLARAGFAPLGHRSLECEPCVNSSPRDLACMKKEDQERLLALEAELGASMFLSPLSSFLLDLEPVQSYLDLFYRGCGNRFGCGL